jgi:hypothetical protein
MPQMKTNVRWLPVWVSLVLLLALGSASTACIVRCIGVHCHAVAKAKNVPPCHNEAPREGPTKPCPQSGVIASADSVAVAKPTLAHVVTWSVPERIAFLPSPAQASAVRQESNSPPGLQSLKLSVVLRV